MSNLLIGDEVYWNDPDEGSCSGHGTFVRHLNDEVAVIKKDDVEIEVFVKELSRASGRYNNHLPRLLAEIEGRATLRNYKEDRE
jgi:hypothetical protein